MCTHKKSQAMDQKSRMISLVLGLLLCVNVAECDLYTKPPSPKKGYKKTNNYYTARKCHGQRGHTAILTDFGGKGDGKTLNTAAFKAAVDNLTNVPGGGLLIVPRGTWLTGSFNLTSNFTLYIHQEAVILASEEESDYPLVDQFPSYGDGRDGSRRYASLITGTNLIDVVITGENGTIDGQGKVWWDKFKNKELKNNTRPCLIEIISSKRVQISNITLLNSPFWNVHPIYCKKVIIEHLTISAPFSVPNTDGINPDSCTNIRIRDTNIETGDDCIAVKSGWDEYGIEENKPTQNLSITGLRCKSPKSAVIALGSEMSGGIKNVRAQNITAIECESGIRLKTAIGRGGYVKDIYVKNLTAYTIYKQLFWAGGDYKTHADGNYNTSAFPMIRNITFRDMMAENVTRVGSLVGIKGDPFTEFCISNVDARLAMDKKNNPWNCSDIGGRYNKVTPTPCKLLKNEGADCAFPEDILDIDKVVLKKCPIY